MGLALWRRVVSSWPLGLAGEGQPPFLLGYDWQFRLQRSLNVCRSDFRLVPSRENRIFCLRFFRFEVQLPGLIGAG